MDLELENKIAVITGASAGIGREVVKALAAESVQTVIIARRGELLVKLQDEIERLGGKRPFAITADLHDRSAAEMIRGKVIDQFGFIDILINNAGGARRLPVDADDAAWDEVFSLNFTAVRKMTVAFLPVMQQRKAGRIINLTGSMEPRGLNAANAAKASVYAWAKGLSREMGKYGITINCIAPGKIHSEQNSRLHPTAESERQFAQANIPLGYFGEPTDVAYLISFLCSPKARYITGEGFHVDGGMHHAL